MPWPLLKISLQTLTKQNVSNFVNSVYEDAFAILQKLGEMETEAV